MKTYFCIILLIAFATVAGATEQERDLLVIRGKRIFSHDMPSLKEAFPNLTIPEFGMISTSNYKGYTATWGVIEDQLYLIGLEAKKMGEDEMLWDEKILNGLKFPVKVPEWSGAVTHSSPVGRFDPNTGKSEHYDEVTTIVFVKSMVTKVEFAVKVPMKSNAEEASE